MGRDEATRSHSADGTGGARGRDGADRCRVAHIILLISNEKNTLLRPARPWPAAPRALAQQDRISIYTCRAGA